MFLLKIFTREPNENYSISISGSIHMSFSRDGKNFCPLNQNYGILFPKAEIASDYTIMSCFLSDPLCYEKDGLYVISGTYHVLKDKEAKGRGRCSWTTRDFITFEELGICEESFFVDLKAVDNNIFVLSDEMGSAICDCWLPLQAERVFLPSEVRVNEPDEINNIKAVFEYSDGSVDEKSVAWNLSKVLGEQRGLVEITGKVRKEVLEYPLARGYADPVLFKWEGMWYFISTNDNLDDIGLYVRRADKVENLFTGNATERCILSYNLEKGFVQTFWAPEFHVIGGELYILFAVGGVKWAPQCHMMKLKRGGDILKPESWEQPVRVKKKDGSYLTEDSITLDMTHFTAKGRDYLAWSYREKIGTPLDSGSMIYIAEINPARPYELISDPVLISRPLYGWENTQGTINNEGPYALISDSKVYLSFSGGSANGYSYAVGYLIADIDADLLKAESWSKTPCPMLSSYSVGIDGPGHNSFYVNDEEKTMIAYHGQLGIRCSAIHRVHFNARRFPVLNLSPDRDIPEGLRDVVLKVEII